MKFRIIIVLGVFLSLSAHAQRKKPEDSPHDKAITKMYSYHRVNMDSMQYLARDILSKSDKDDDYALTCANHGLGVALYHQHFYDSALYYFLEAMQFAKKKSFSNSEYGHMDLLYNCGVELKRTGSFELSEQFLEDALSIAVSMGDTVRMIKFNHGLSITYEELADYPKAIALVSEAIRLSKLSGKDYPIAYVSLGNYCRKNKDFAKATDVLTTLIQDSAALNTKSGIHTSYYLSKTYSDQGDVKRAEEVLRRAILTDPGKSKNGYFYCLYELGVLLKQQGNTDEAIEYLTRAEAYVDDNPDNEREFFEVFQVLSNLHNLTNKELADTYHQKYLDALDKYTNNHRRYNLGKVVEDYYANIEQEAREASVRTYSVVISSSLLVLLGLTFSVSQYQRHRTKKKLEKESIDKR
ncbi:MAG: tetratricopeptide repeat protein, partial [Bacteroidota bacterium]